MEVERKILKRGVREHSNMKGKGDIIQIQVTKGNSWECRAERAIEGEISN